jgi:putative ABC transport system permease protein
VGVVGDTRDLGLDRNAPPTFYWSAWHFPTWNLSLVLRTRTEPLALASAIRKAAAGMDSSALVSDVTTVEQLVSESLSSRRLNMLMLAIFAALALVLAAVGIYGVMAYSVNQRRHEIGVRMALGAVQTDVLRLVIGKALLLGGLGVVAGSAAALGLTRLMAGMLYGVKPADPLTFGCVAFLLFAVALAASYLPARRATRLDPLAALRCE